MTGVPVAAITSGARSSVPRRVAGCEQYRHWQTDARSECCGFPPIRGTQALLERQPYGPAPLGRSQRARARTPRAHALGLLRARRERPRRRRAAEQRDELPPSHAGQGGSLPPGVAARSACHRCCRWVLGEERPSIPAMLFAPFVAWWKMCGETIRGWRARPSTAE